jgi:hypothetical protein
MAMTDEEIAYTTAASLDARNRWSANDRTLGGQEGADLQYVAIILKREGISDPVGILYRAVQRKIAEPSFDNLDFSSS